MFFKFEHKNKPNDTSKKDLILKVDKNRCPQDHVCPAMRVCPVGALSQKGFSLPVVDHSKCLLCGKCVKFCPKKALILEPK
ncbi:MAG: 4Fe-4S binding protein [Lachnospiraceae bacterium]|nr:4Fe-4S binding protein [Lachnospiraceae bacterium]